MTEPKPKYSSRLGSSSKKEEVYSHEFSKEGDLEKGSTDTPQLALALNTANQRTSIALT